MVSDSGLLTDIAALADRVASEFGTFDALFVNAGVTRFAPFEATTEQVYDELLAISAKGPYFTVQRLAPLLVPGSGVVLTTSVANVLAIPMVSAYAASKAALRSMARTLARELLERQVRVNAVSPGAIETGVLDRSMPQDAAEQATAQMTADNPMLRFGQPAEVATAAASPSRPPTPTAPSFPWTAEAHRSSAGPSATHPLRPSRPRALPGGT